MYFLQSLSTYRELIETGELHSSAGSETINVDLKGNISGDILIFISPKKTVAFWTDTLDMARADAQLQVHVNEAFKLFRNKFSSLTLLPTSLIWILNIGLSSVLISSFSGNIIEVFSGNDLLTGFSITLPVLLLTLLTAIFGKQLGFKLLKPVIAVITRIIRGFRWVRNRKISGKAG